MSLVETIVGMAQNYIGSNNINLLLPNGQFGSRNLGGKDHASARYIFTQLNKVARYIFPEPDDHSLTYVEEDG
jgi:DNA topoisomerase-2